MSAWTFLELRHNVAKATKWQVFGVERLFFESVVNDTFEEDSEESKHSEGHEDEDHEEDYS